MGSIQPHHRVFPLPSDIFGGTANIFCLPLSMKYSAEGGGESQLALIWAFRKLGPARVCVLCLGSPTRSSREALLNV